MRSANMFLGALGVERAVMQDCADEAVPTDQQAYVVRVRPTQKESGRCVVCGRRCPGSDHREGVDRWRAMDLGMCMTGSPDRVVGTNTADALRERRRPRDALASGTDGSDAMRWAAVGQQGRRSDTIPPWQVTRKSQAVRSPDEKAATARSF